MNSYGDTTMKVPDFQKAKEFLGKTFFAPAVSDSGVLIRFVEIDNWLRVMIELGEDTTSDDLRSAIPLALLWRDKLLESQGPWMRGGDNPFLEELSDRHKSGQSYNELANRINQTIKHSFETMLDFTGVAVVTKRGRSRAIREISEHPDALAR